MYSFVDLARYRRRILLAIVLLFTLYTSSSAQGQADCVIGWPVQDRAHKDGGGWAMVAPGKQLCSGQITVWSYRPKSALPFRAIVFRPVEGGSVTEFRIVGINDIPARSVINTDVHYEVPEGDRITVIDGDVIGWSSGDGVIAYNTGGSDLIRWLSSDSTGLLSGQTLNINSGSGPRQYSISASVQKQNADCVIGWPVQDRAHKDGGGWAMVAPGKRLCSGQITGWSYRPKSSLPFRAIVFRPVEGGSVTEFSIVGINDIPARSVINTDVHYEVPEGDRITVIDGDVIGWSSGDGVIAYNTGGSDLIRWLSSDSTGLLSGQTLNISSGSGPRQYSISASVQNADCVIGWPVQDRVHKDGGGWAMVAPGKRLCSGQITVWSYRPKSTLPFRAIVFRPVEGGFRIVGINDIPARSVINTNVHYEVPEGDRITAIEGDVIGWSSGDGVIAYNTGGSDLIRWLSSDSTGLLSGQTLNINSGSGLREYSISALVQKQNGHATCQQRLGVEDGRITDRQLTASTEYAHSVYHGAHNARLNRTLQTGTTGSWSAQTNDDKQWIQAEFSDQKWVTGVLIQGRQDCCPQYVTKFKVQYSDDGVYWKYVQQTNNAGEMIFNGNTDQNTVVTAFFPTPVKATFIRILPTAWNQHISMRFELLGCEADICQEPAGLEDGRITDGQITASSEFASSIFHGASNGRLNRQAKPGTTGAWSAQTNDINQWIQAGLGANVFVTGVMTQGRQDVQDQWVTKFKVQHSNDGVYWKYVQDPSSKLDKVFDGNSEPHRAVVKFFPSPVKASFVRIRPTAWSNHISMRFEVLACNTC